MPDRLHVGVTTVAGKYLADAEIKSVLRWCRIVDDHGCSGRKNRIRLHLNPIRCHPVGWGASVPFAPASCSVRRGVPSTTTQRGGELLLLHRHTAYHGTQRKRTTNTKANWVNVTIPAILVPLLLEWQENGSDPSPAALMFPSTNKNGRSRKGRLYALGICLQRKVHHVAIGLNCYVNFRVTRRTASTLF